MSDLAHKTYGMVHYDEIKEEMYADYKSAFSTCEKFFGSDELEYAASCINGKIHSKDINSFIRLIKNHNNSKDIILSLPKETIIQIGNRYQSYLHSNMQAYNSFKGITLDDVKINNDLILFINPLSFRFNDFITLLLQHNIVYENIIKYFYATFKEWNNKEGFVLLNKMNDYLKTISNKIQVYSFITYFKSSCEENNMICELEM